ncbi:hypothetical protein [Bacillus sp. UNC41MFS5]|uniref:hypothetical protein n=1 Tax=Bacillus sp. UNC41MFS5 TaxID=1449046 RepID=UPI001E637E85|nr:hypothetical protein [Bacillus sp. UNC41MFS5]
MLLTFIIMVLTVMRYKCITMWSNSELTIRKTNESFQMISLYKLLNKRQKSMRDLDEFS